MTSNRYPPVPPTAAPLHTGERHLHSFRVRGYRYRPLAEDPAHEEYLAHLTERRVVLEPVGADEAPLSLPWNDVIEFQPVRGSRIVDELPGVEEHMMLVVTKSEALQREVDMLLLSAEPVDDPSPAARAGHSAAFLEIVEELLLEAFEA